MFYTHLHHILCVIYIHLYIIYKVCIRNYKINKIFTLLYMKTLE